jgi:hypothetical protein
MTRALAAEPATAREMIIGKARLPDEKAPNQKEGP